jgi:hypothetical protein
MNMILPLISDIDTSQGNVGKFVIVKWDEESAGFGLSSGEN